MLWNIEDGLIMIRQAIMKPPRAYRCYKVRTCLDGLMDVRSRAYKMCDYRRRNEELRPSTIVKDVLFNDSRWLHDQGLRLTSHAKHQDCISRAWLLWKRIAYLTLACVVSVSEQFRRLILHQNFSHAWITKCLYPWCSATLAWRESSANTGSARGTRELERKPPLFFSPRASSRFLPSRQKNWHLKQARTCLVPSTVRHLPMRRMYFSLHNTRFTSQERKTIRKKN